MRALHRRPAFLRLYRLLPHRLLNGVAGRLSRARRPRRAVRWLVDAWVRRAGIDLDDCVSPRFDTIEEFFLRELRPGARPAGAGITSPADGRLVDIGTLSLGTPLCIKGHPLSLARLVNGRHHDLPLDAYEGGAYAVVFLTPHGYHHVHMPEEGELVDVRWIPGRFFPQNEDALRVIPRVYERNERAVLRCLGARGESLLVLVGASLIGGIHLRAAPREAWVGPGTTSLSRACRKGEPIGHFAFGSTVVLLLPRSARARPLRAPGNEVRVGEPLFARDEK